MVVHSIGGGRLRAIALGLPLALLAGPVFAQSPRSDNPFAALTPTTVIEGFRTVAVYADAANRPIGARFIHQRSNFTLDVVRQQSVPQIHLWVNTFPTTDQGEPHTQEHLLIGKGSKGRALSTIASASLATWTAFTGQWRTSYQFNTVAGASAFYTLFDTEMDALLNPDYNEEEIRREIRNFGISEDPATHALTLEEKGSVYNEMSISSASMWSRWYREATGLVYGREHPLARNSGGEPAGIRTMRPEEIRVFHAQHYYPANMGAIVSVPDAMPLEEVLGNIGRTLTKYDRTPAKKAAVTSLAELPKPQAAPGGTVRIASFPHSNAQQPGLIVLAWPATRDLSVDELQLASLFLDAFAGDPTTNIYKLFVDTKTRRLDLGAKESFGWVDSDPGNVVNIGLSDVEPRHMTEAKLDTVRTIMVAELRRVAALRDGSPELREFNYRVKSRIISRRRELSKFVNSPPRFGFRNAGAEWLGQIDEVNRTDGFTKSLVLTPAMRVADSVTSSPANLWRGYLAKWQLTTTTPYVVAAKPDPALVTQAETERRARVAAEITRLKTQYGASDDQDAIRRYKAEYDRASGELDRLNAAERTKLVSDLPMTLDDPLDYKTEQVRGVRVVSSTFESMTSVTTGLALSLANVAEQDLVYMAALPALLTQVGIIRNGVPMPYEKMSELQRREILSLGATFATNARTGRVELVVRGAGNDDAEGIKALGWMRDVLTTPDWRPANLGRIRDVVDQQLAGLRSTQQNRPEAWVQGVANAYRRQSDARYLSAASFLTRQHHLLRLRWLLMDAGDAAQRSAIDNWMAQLAVAGASADRAGLAAMLKAVGDTTAALPGAAGLAAVPTLARRLSGGARTLAVDAALDLSQSLSEIPDGSLRPDWNYLVTRMRKDLLVPPATALAAMDRMRSGLLTTGQARSFVISSSATRRAIAPSLDALIGVLQVAPRVAAPAGRRIVDDRLRSRMPSATKPVFVGLLDPNMQSGVMMNSSPGVTYAETGSRALTRFLASRIYGGGGAHSISSRTSGAGLAYSNGIGGSPTSGRVQYYAERTPELPQTLGFVIQQLKKSPHDTTLVEYVMTLVFAETRAGDDFESRGEGMANDLADGQTPAAVRAFRERVLALRRSRPALGKEMYAQMDSVYADLLPGYVPGMRNVDGAVYFVIGAEKQFSAYEKYLKSAVAPSAELYRLYPRDFWVTPP
jgi:hypothetical protein